MTTLCPVPRCGQEISPDRIVCRDCVRVLKHDLASVPALVEDLLVTITRQDRLGSSGGRRGGETAIPWKAYATDVLWDLTNTVVGWMRVLIEHYCLRRDGTETQDWKSHPHQAALLASRWLLANLNSLAMHEAADEAVDDIGHAVQRAYRAIDRPADKLPAGQCGVDDCETYLYAEPQAETVDCRGCGTTHTMEERHAWMSEAATEYRVTATEAYGWIRQLLGKQMPESTWRRWMSENRIAYDDVDHLGHRLYRWGDVRDAVSDWVARPRKVKEEAA